MAEHFTHVRRTAAAVAVCLGSVLGLGGVMAGQGPTLGLNAGDDFIGDVSSPGLTFDPLANDAVFGTRAFDPFSFELLSTAGGFVEVTSVSSAGVEVLVRPHPAGAARYRVCLVDVGGHRPCDTATIWLTDGPLSAIGPWDSERPTRQSPVFLGPPFAPPLNGDLYTFITDGLPPDALTSLRFLVDGVPVGVERFAPYDVAGGSATTANPFDARRLPDGLHTLTSEFAFAPSAGGYVERVDTPLRIENRRTENGYVLGVSGSPTRRPGRFLDGAFVGDEVVVFLGRLPLVPNQGPVPAPADDITDVTFLLNGVSVQTERLAPYDMGGGTTAEARPFDLSGLGAGPHQVEALVRRGDGSSVPVTATFDQESFGFTLTTVDSAGDVGQQSSIAIGTDGLPVVAYSDDTNDDLKVAHCGNLTCTAGNTLTKVDTGEAGLDPSIAIGADGLPVVSYQGNPSGDLKVAHCGNVTCTAGNTLTTVDSDGGGGSITIGADGLPVVSYSGGDNHKIAHCGNVTCTAGNTLTTVDSAGSGGSIAIGADGLPVVSYSGGGIKLLHCGNVTCTAGNTLTTVEPFFQSATSIAIGADGLPVVSYQDFLSVIPGTLYQVTHCGNVTCTTHTTATIDDRKRGGTASSLPPSSIATGADGLPVVSYGDFSSGEGLTILHCGSVTCTASNTLTTVDSVGVGESSITIGADGLPVVSYRDNTAGALKVAHCGDPVTCK